MTSSPPKHNVPRRTFPEGSAPPEKCEDDLQIYSAVLVKWQKYINLTGPEVRKGFCSSALQEAIALRTVMDNFQENRKVCADLGSGAGLPGILLAILFKNNPPQEETCVHLVERNNKKCAFLREIIRQTHIPAVVHQISIEQWSPAAPLDFIIARALAPLTRLLTMSQHLFSKTTQGLFLKGSAWSQEEAQAKKRFDFQSTCYHLRKRGVIMHITALNGLNNRSVKQKKGMC